jgi:hypothetical protein
MRNCSVIKKLQIVRGGFEDYKKLARFHYRDSRLGAYTAIFVIKPDKGISKEPVGVIVYTMPSVGAELRNIATGNLFVGLDKGTRLALINKNIRRISRVIIEPRFRGLGLASRLVRETMPKINAPIIEAMAVMGLVNPFFEKAGMKAFTAKMPARCVQLVEAFSMVGIEGEELIDPEGVQRKLDRLGKQEAEFIESQIKHFLQSYGRRRYERAGLERTGFVLSKLTFRPVYYIWFNPGMAYW